MRTQLVETSGESFKKEIVSHYLGVWEFCNGIAVSFRWQTAVLRCLVKPK